MANTNPSPIVGGGGPFRRPAPRGLVDTSASPFVRVSSVGLGEVRWTGGFWAARFATCRGVMAPGMWRLMQGGEPSHFFQNIRIAAGLVEGRHRGPQWNDGDFYKWLEAAAAVYAVAPDDELDRQMDEIIAVIARAQRPDGYIHTPVLIAERAGDRHAEPFRHRMNFETYNMGHLMTTACVHYRATGKRNLLAVAGKAADFLCAAFKRSPEELAGHAICPAHYMGIVEMYRTTREPRYLELVKQLIDLRDRVANGTDDNQDRIPFRQQVEAVGHAVRANYLYAGVADVYAETGDQTLLDALERIWQNVVSCKMYVTGACGALYDGASPDGARDQSAITRVHQAYGRNYQLPQSTAHNETCASIGNALWNWRMLQISGEARFADIVELVLYNSALAGISLDGTSFFYANTLRQLDEMPVQLRWSRRREKYISCFCCPPNIVRTIAEASNYAYGKSQDAIWVHLYGSSVLQTQLPGGVPLRLVQESDYPWSGYISITVGVPAAQVFTVMLRIPGWAREAMAYVNGRREASDLPPGSYYELRRAWQPGDVIELHLPMPVRLMEAHPLVEEACNQVAVQRGPVVYCLESTDLPEGTRVSQVRISRHMQLAPRYAPDLLGGVTALEGQAQAWSTSSWKGQLYRELALPRIKDIGLRLVPYLAWGNRGHSEMTVWLPLI